MNYGGKRMKETVTLKVKSDSAVKKVAGSISHALKGGENTPSKDVELLAIGAGAVNQTVKALAISSGHIANGGRTLKFRVGFKVADINGEEKTMMRFFAEVE